jgi:hypothetical protein
LSECATERLNEADPGGVARRTASAKWGEAPALDGWRATP